MLDKRISKRVTFQDSRAVVILAIDGTWRIKCKLLDISHTGARILVLSELRPQLDRFVLLLSANGIVKRFCNVSWQNDNEFGVIFENNSGLLKRTIRPTL